MTSPRWRGVWWISFAAALLLYVSTANRGVQWQDSGWQQLRIAAGDIHHPSGLVLYHPLHYHLGRALVLLDVWQPAFAATFVSCLSSAAAVASLAALLWLITRSMLATAASVAAFSLSHTFWQHATHTETYGLVAALLSGEWLCLTLFALTSKKRYLLCLAFLNGLGVANHLLAALATPVDIVVIAIACTRQRRDIRTAALAAGVWLVGSLPFTGLVVSELISSGDWSGTMRSAFFGIYEDQVLNVALDAGSLLLVLGFIAYNFPGLTMPLAAIGLARRGRIPRLLSAALLAQLLLYSLFVVRYSIRDQYTFFVPVYAILTLFAGFGMREAIAWLTPIWRRLLIVTALISACWTPWVYWQTAAVMREKGWLRGMVGNQPYRDGYRAFLVPWGVGQTHADDLNRRLFTLLGDDGLVVFDAAMMRFAVFYEQRLKPWATQIEFLTTRQFGSPQAAEASDILRSAFDAGRAVVQIPRDRDAPAEVIAGAIWHRDGDLYVLQSLPTPKAGPPTP